MSSDTVTVVAYVLLLSCTSLIGCSQATTEKETRSNKERASSRSIEDAGSSTSLSGQAAAGLPVSHLVANPNGPLRFREIAIGVPEGNYSAVAMGDLDGNGKAELVSGRIEKEEGLFVFVEQNGSWNKQSLTTRGEYGGVAIADLDGDGRLEVVAVKTDAKGSTDGMEIVRLSGRGAKLAAAEIHRPFTGKACSDVAVGDIEGDGDIDIATSTRGDGVKVLINSGNGRDFQQLDLDTKIYEDTGIAMGDVNNDGRMDVISSNHPGENPRLFLCNSEGPVEYSDAHTAGVNSGPGIGYRLCFAMLDSDESMDLIVGTESGIKLFTGNQCMGSDAQWWKSQRLVKNGGGTVQGVAQDVDLDGDVDIVYASNRGVMLWLNDGAANFELQTDLGLPDRGDYSGCFLADWDQDGDLDVACSSLKGLGVRLYENLVVE